MNAYLNDLSCGEPGLPLTDNIQSVQRFFNLLEAMGNFGFKQVIVDNPPGRVRLCNTRLAEVHGYKSYFEHRNLILSLINHLILAEELDQTMIFKYKDKESVLLAHACDSGRGAVSFVFSPEFEVDEINGFRDNRSAKVTNFHSAEQLTSMPSRVVSAIDCRKNNPAVNPLWNLETTKAYHNSKNVTDKLTLISKYPARKIAILEEISETIAELNGWIRDDYLSKINSTDNAVRTVYRSEKFSKTAYLSTDFEKRDVYFELFDKRGRHKGEYKWDGSRSEDASPLTHTLKLKRS